MSPHFLALPAPMTAGLWLLAQSTGSPGFDLAAFLGQLGVAGAAVVWALRSEKRAERAEEREREAVREQISAERQAKQDQIEILERLGPLVVAATAALESTTAGLSHQVKVSRSESDPVLRETLARLMDKISEIEERLPRPGRRER